MTDSVIDNKKWDKAKIAFKKTNKKDPKSSLDYAQVTQIYKKMGGKFSKEMLELVEQIQGMININKSYMDKLESISEVKYKTLKDVSGRAILGGVRVKIMVGKLKGKLGYMYNTSPDGKLIRVTSKPQTGLLGWYKPNELSIKPFVKESYTERLNNLKEFAGPQRGSGSLPTSKDKLIKALGKLDSGRKNTQAINKVLGNRRTLNELSVGELQQLILDLKESYIDELKNMSEDRGKINPEYSKVEKYIFPWNNQRNGVDFAVIENTGILVLKLNIAGRGSETTTEVRSRVKSIEKAIKYADDINKKKINIYIK